MVTITQQVTQNSMVTMTQHATQNSMVMMTKYVTQSSTVMMTKHVTHNSMVMMTEHVTHNSMVTMTQRVTHNSYGNDDTTCYTCRPVQRGEKGWEEGGYAVEIHTEETQHVHSREGGICNQQKPTNNHTVR